MDYGYKDWQNVRKKILKKRLNFLFKVIPIIIIILLLVFFFGYDKSMLDKDKLIEFFGGTIGIILFFVILSLIMFKTPKYNPTCNKCGNKIGNIEKNCEILKVKYLGTKDKIIYKTKKSRIKGKTTYPRGGYSLRNDTYEYSSESTYEVEEKVPVMTKIYLYDITYGCKYCHEKIATIRKETSTPLNEKGE